ncbi:3-(3-hydroxyphenyl)propionate hydroxylase [Burkholderia humptydooensis MSMB43]|uniref:3-(3-hydroxyphenyl)propionate hydroxylase n=1 Tax=Burkholderia humptydooensis MSMB43 TaxID=441157 RepID=A0ABN0FXQ5_9BURK|nr:3-(3-hydroxyphenyl)propionate hydroxylase [Burkholderia humptydooensis MSMB43]
MVVQGTAHDALLDTYTAERRAHARSMIHLSEVVGDGFAPRSFFGSKMRDAFVRCFDVLPSMKRYFVEMRFKPMRHYEDGVVLLARRERSEGRLACMVAKPGHGAFWWPVGLMSEKRESLIGQMVHGRDAQAGTPVGRMFIQPRVRLEDGSIVRHRRCDWQPLRDHGVGQGPDIRPDSRRASHMDRALGGRDREARPAARLPR